MTGKRLKKGDTIGIIAPAGFSSEVKVENAKKNIENMGFKVVLGKCTSKKWYSFAGTDDERAQEVNDFFADDTIDAIVCMRGGYGCNRILEKLDLELIKIHPKIFVGYSDITTLHIYLNEKAGLITFHGPMAVSNFIDEYNIDTCADFLNMVTGNFIGEIKNIDQKFEFIKKGSAKGKIVGGNLATLVATLGTEYDLDYTDKILFLEEIGENTYKIDRLLNQLKKHGVFKKIFGIILGDFKNCKKCSEEDMDLLIVFKDYFMDFQGPVVSNVQSGHCEPMITIPLGAMCEIDGKKKKITITEDVVF